MATRKSTSGQGAQQAHSYVQMAVTLARQNRFAEAVQAFRQASRMDPRNVQVQYGLGNCYAAIGDIDNAIIAFRQTVEDLDKFIAGARPITDATAEHSPQPPPEAFAPS